MSPEKTCACGCGQAVTAPRFDYLRGHNRRTNSSCQVAGCKRPHHANRLCSTHSSRLRRGLDQNGPIRDCSPRTPERFWASVDRSGGPEACWPWTGKITDNGYGRSFTLAGSDKAYHVGWVFTFGDRTPGMQIDHVCHTRDLSCDAGNECLHRRCCNPAHLEEVTPAENYRRSRGPARRFGQRTHCDAGHPFSGTNLAIRRDGTRRCRACSAAYSRRRSAARRAS